MPIYEYVCRACGSQFDHLWPSVAAADEAASREAGLGCPHCQSSDTTRLVSQVAVLGGLGGLTPGEEAAAAGQAERASRYTSREQIDALQANRKRKGEQSPPP